MLSQMTLIMTSFVTSLVTASLEYDDAAEQNSRRIHDRSTAKEARI